MQHTRAHVAHGVNVRAAIEQQFNDAQKSRVAAQQLREVRIKLIEVDAASGEFALELSRVGEAFEHLDEHVSFVLFRQGVEWSEFRRQMGFLFLDDLGQHSGDLGVDRPRTPAIAGVASVGIGVH